MLASQGITLIGIDTFTRPKGQDYARKGPVNSRPPREIPALCDFLSHGTVLPHKKQLRQVHGILKDVLTIIITALQDWP